MFIANIIDWKNKWHLFQNWDVLTSAIDVEMERWADHRSAMGGLTKETIIYYFYYILQLYIQGKVFLLVSRPGRFFPIESRALFGCRNLEGPYWMWSMSHIYCCEKRNPYLGHPVRLCSKKKKSFSPLIGGKNKLKHLPSLPAHSWVGFVSPDLSHWLSSAVICPRRALKMAALWGHQRKALTAHICHGHSHLTPKIWPHGWGKRLWNRLIY